MQQSRDSSVTLARLFRSRANVSLAVWSLEGDVCCLLLTSFGFHTITVDLLENVTVSALFLRQSLWSADETGDVSHWHRQTDSHHVIQQSCDVNTGCDVIICLDRWPTLWRAANKVHLCKVCQTDRSIAWRHAVCFVNNGMWWRDVTSCQRPCQTFPCSR